MVQYYIKILSCKLDSCIQYLPLQNNETQQLSLVKCNKKTFLKQTHTAEISH